MSKKPSAMNDGELLAYLGTDAQRWAHEFMRIKAEIDQAEDLRSSNDEGWMIGWFANALAAGETAGRVARMTGTTITTDDATVAAIGRAAEFVRQWQIARNKGDLIYGVHHDIDADMADLTVTDLTTVLAALTGVPHD